MPNTSTVHSRRSSSSAPEFADPWFLRRTPPIEPVAVLDGTAQATTLIRRGGQPIVQITAERLQPDNSSIRSQRPMLVELRRRVSATISKYRLAGWCTEVELATIDALWSEGISLRELSRRQGVTAQAISSRIERMGQKAPEFCRWWRLKHHTRRRWN